MKKQDSRWLSCFQVVKEVQMDFFDNLKQYLIFVPLRSTKILALLAARLVMQGFAGYSIPFEAGFAPSGCPTHFGSGCK